MRIAFYGRYGRPVTGKTLEETGCGGSESALVYMALELYKLGNEVYVFNQCKDKHGDYDGVKYRDVTEFGQVLKSGIKFDVLVVFRDLDILKVLGPNTTGIGINKKVYWAHDDLSYLWPDPAKLKEIGSWLNDNTDRVFAVSNWQAEVYNEKFGVDKNKVFITRNGVNLDQYKNKIKKEENRLIYTSVPDRGLDILVKIFPEIKKQAGAELYVYSSFKVYGSPDTDLKLKDIFDQATAVGIKLMPTRPQKELAIELQKSAIMLYPNHKSTFHPVYAETSCIAVLEAQAAGTPVITSRRGALPESVGENGILIDGDPYSPEYQSKFIEATVKLLKDNVLRQKLGESAKQRMASHYSWPGLAKEWLEEFSRLIK